MQGLAQTNWTTWVKINQVTDFIYVFHVDSIQSGLYANCYGMKNSFYTRYKVFTHRGHNTITTIAQNDHIPFSHMRSSLHPESSHHQIFPQLPCHECAHNVTVATRALCIQSDAASIWDGGPRARA